MIMIMSVALRLCDSGLPDANAYFSKEHVKNRLTLSLGHTSSRLKGSNVPTAVVRPSE